MLDRDGLCEPTLCLDAPDEAGERCSRCPLDHLDASLQGAFGALIANATDIRRAAEMGVAVALDDIRFDEWLAMRIIDEERDRHERERDNNKR